MTSNQNPTDALSIAAALNNGRIFANHDSHDFNGIDGRCYWCDCRPYGRHAPHPCDAAPQPVVPEADWDAYLEMSYVDPAERDLP